MTAGWLPRNCGAAVLAVVVAGLPRPPLPLQAQNVGHITTPREQFGWEIGDNYRLVNYTQYVAYLKQIDRESDRLTVIDIGPTAEGRREYTAIVTSPANHQRLQQYKEINRRLALAETLTDEEARRLARDGKVVVWIDGGLHATEVLGAQQLIETMYRLASGTGPETLRILNDDIVLLTLVNPDGMELVSNWYMRNPVETERSTAYLPRLYQKYVGHDNNRDLYMMNQPESENANRILYREWFPAIVYNHHQTGPQGAVLFAPPYRDPFNYHFDPLIPMGIEMVGAAIHERLAVEGKPGAVMREAATYSTWWNGGLRTTAYFHNQIGILTEMIGNPTPVQIPFVPEFQLPSNDVPNPVAPQTWHFRQSIEYSLTANYAVLDLASKRKEDFLFNMYKMGKNSIGRGSGDHWTTQPRQIEAVIAEMEKVRPGSDGRDAAPVALFDRMLRDPELRDPRGYILPSDQPDFLTAVKFVNILVKSGITVQRATAAFTVDGTSYPEGSYVVKTAQAFRPHVMDMFEPQDHPDDFRYPGGPPIAPYDVAGYNLAYTMGFAYDRILDAFDGPFEPLIDVVKPPPGRVEAAPEGGGWLFSHRVNDAFVAVNRLLAADQDVRWVKNVVPAFGQSMFVAARSDTLPILQQLARAKGLSFEAVAARPPGELVQLHQQRIGLWDQYGGSIPSGWTRWLLEQFEFPFEIVYPQILDAGRLADTFDVLIFVDGAIPARDRVESGPAPASIPEEYRSQLGSVTVSKTVPELRRFVEEGGTLLTIGSSTVIGRHFDLPVRDALTRLSAASGREVALSPEEFFVPGSILEARVDNAHPLAYGLDERVKLFFDHSPAFRLEPAATSKGVRVVAWFDTPHPLVSGWAWGQEYLDQTAQIVDVRFGEGHVVLIAPEIVWRAQTHATFKLLFNGIFLGLAD